MTYRSYPKTTFSDHRPVIGTFKLFTYSHNSAQKSALFYKIREEKFQRVQGTDYENELSTPADDDFTSGLIDLDFGDLEEKKGEIEDLENDFFMNN